jgi:hypothetical protein
MQFAGFSGMAFGKSPEYCYKREAVSVPPMIALAFCCFIFYV